MPGGSRMVPFRRDVTLAFMAPKLSDEQRQAIEEHGGEPVYVDDPVKRVQYVLVPANVFERLRVLMTAQVFDLVETYPGQEQTLSTAGWDDPQMDAYDRYDDYRSKS